MTAPAAPTPTPPVRWSGVYPAAARAGKLRRRHAINTLMAALVGLAAVLATLPLVIVLVYLLKAGASSLQWHFFTNMPKPVGESGGGMANAIVGTLMLVGTASVIGLPVGIGAGLYLAEHRGSRLANTTRFLADVLNGLPSIVMGIFAWQILVRPVGHFSAWAGGVALAAMMIPQVARTTEEIVRTVPVSLREAALALGYARWRTSLTVVLRTATAGVVTGALVAIARIAGETAPLLFTAFGNQFWSTSLNQPVAALPLQIYTYALSPYDDWHSQAWAGALVLIALILIISLVARVATRGRFATAGD
jgi:phosphate transport system permease protein